MRHSTRVEPVPSRARRNDSWHTRYTATGSFPSTTIRGNLADSRMLPCAVFPQLRLATNTTGYRRFRQAMQEGRLQPGMIVTQNELCAILGISLTPLRETLVLLEEFGLVEVKPRAGIRVVYPEVTFIRENYHQNALEAESLAERIAIFRQMYAALGRVRIRQTIATDPHHVVVLTEAEKADGLLLHDLTVDPEHPHSILTYTSVALDAG